MCLLKSFANEARCKHRHSYVGTIAGSPLRVNSKINYLDSSGDRTVGSCHSRGRHLPGFQALFLLRFMSTLSVRASVLTASVFPGCISLLVSAYPPALHVCRSHMRAAVNRGGLATQENEHHTTPFP